MRPLLPDLRMTHRRAVLLPWGADAAVGGLAPLAASARGSGDVALVGGAAPASACRLGDRRR